jgi:SAM-dependent methyltransferase
MPATTPLRTLVGPHPSENLSPDRGADERSQHLLEVLSQARDRSSWSDELSTHVDHWEDRFHLSNQRANVVRGLALDDPDAVLEIGAAAGALTRYLGENASVVDALETDRALAAAARLRCADLPHVVVHELDLDDVPAEPAYDLIVAADVPASSGTAGDDLARLLQTCRRLLRPGGHVVVAVDNTDGVRRRAGGRPPARGDGGAPLLASRDELERAASTAGLGAQVLGAFPDHRHTVTLIDHAALREIDVALLERIVHLPSPPSGDGDDVVDGAQEIRSWTEAVAAGTDDTRANSLVLVAGEHPVALDPLTYWSSGRRADLSACNRVRRTSDGPVVVRAHAHPSAPRGEGPLSLRPHTEPYVVGTLLVDVLAATEDADEAVPLVRTWVELLDRSDDGGPVPWDLIPRNVQVDGAGSAHAIDQEWAHATADRRYVLMRGAFWLGYDLLHATPPPAWLAGHTVASAADVLLALGGEDVPVDWRDFLDAEAVSMASVAPRSAREPLEAKIRKERRNLSYLSHRSVSSDDRPATDTVIEGLSAANRELRARVEQLELARRHDEIVARDHAIGLRAKLETALREVGRTRKQLARQRSRSKQLEAEIGALRGSTSFRLGRRIVAPVARLTRRDGA